MSEDVCLNKIDSMGTATILLNRPDYHNALDENMVHLLQKHFQANEENHSVRVVILRGRGESFCSGIDLHWMKVRRHDDSSGNNTAADELAKLLWVMHHLNKPIVAIVNGPVFGGGIGLIACCDIVLGTRSARFCFSEVRLGLIPGVISPYVINAIGPRVALRYFLTAECFDAVEAHRIGLIHEVLSGQSMGRHTGEITKALVAGGPGALTRTKQLVDRVANQPLNNLLVDTTIEWMSEVRITAEAQEGVNAFFDKRPASWTAPG